MSTTQNEKHVKTRVIHKHDFEKNWEKAENFVPKQGELIIYDIEVDAANQVLDDALVRDDNGQLTNKFSKNTNRTTPYTYERFKIGDGIKNVNDLPFAGGPEDSAVKLSEDIWTDKTIGYINGTTSSPKKVANAGDTLKTMFTNIFGTVTDDTTNLVTNPYFSSVSIGNSSYEYGTKLNSVSVTVTPVAGSYKYGPSTTGSSWSGNYTLSGTGFTTKKDKTNNTQTVSLSSTFTVGTSSALTLTASRAYTAATTTAKSKMGNTTTQKISAGTATKSGTFNPTAKYYVYYAVTDSTTITPSSWILYDPNNDSIGQTSVEDLELTCGKNQYLWIASYDTSTSANIYAVNQASGKYNTDPIPTTKSTAKVKNKQDAEVTYNIFRTTNALSLATTNKFKLKS